MCMEEVSCVIFTFMAYMICRISPNSFRLNLTVLRNEEGKKRFEPSKPNQQKSSKVTTYNFV